MLHIITLQVAGNRQKTQQQDGLFSLLIGVAIRKTVGHGSYTTSDGVCFRGTPMSRSLCAGVRSDHGADFGSWCSYSEDAHTVIGTPFLRATLLGHSV